MPRPNGWQQRNGRTVLGILLFGDSAVLSGMWTFARLQRGHHLEAAILAGAGVFVCASLRWPCSA